MPGSVVYCSTSANSHVKLFVSRRIIIDNGEVTEPIEGYVTLSRHVLREFSQQNLQLFVRVFGRFSYLNSSSINYGVPMAYGYGFATSAHQNSCSRHVFHQESVLLHEGLAEKTTDKSLLKIPFAFILPENLPPSFSIFNSHLSSQNLGVLYGVETFLQSTSPATPASPHIVSPHACALKIIKTHIVLDSPEPQSAVAVPKSQSHPCHVKATLLKSVVEVGSPLEVELSVDNQSGKDVRSIVAHLKQTIATNMNPAGAAGKHYSESSTAIVCRTEWREGVPDQTSTTRKLVVLPVIDSLDASRMAFLRLRKNDPPELCCSYCSAPGTYPAVSISYYLNIKLKMGGGHELKLKLPLQISNGCPLFQEFPSTLISDQDRQEWGSQLVEMGFPADHVKLALDTLRSGTLGDVIDWMGAHPQMCSHAGESLKSQYILKNNKFLCEDSGSSRPGSRVLVVENEADFI
eukprot:Sdes_comp20199_c0_seq1m13505